MIKFDTGKCVATAMVSREFDLQEICALLDRHVSGDWGDLGKEDIEANEYALKNDLRIFSAYNTDKGKVYVITEHDRSYTTVMFADEY